MLKILRLLALAGAACFVPLSIATAGVPEPILDVHLHAVAADDQIIMKSIALGWPDETFPANAVISERRPVNEAAIFRGFDD